MQTKKELSSGWWYKSPSLSNKNKNKTKLYNVVAIAFPFFQCEYQY